MGLASYWETPKGTDHPVFKPPLHLYDASDNDKGKFTSFNGGVYVCIIFAASNISLYQKEISNDQIKDIAICLKRTSLKKLQKQTDLKDTTFKEFKDLKRMFRVYADIGVSLKGSW